MHTDSVHLASEYPASGHPASGQPVSGQPDAVQAETVAQPVRTDYLIIGAGPAGLQLGYFLQQAGRDYLILEAGAGPGTFFERFPRHRQLISINKVYTGYDDPEINLRWDWNSLLCDDAALLFKNYSRAYFPPAGELVRYLADFAARYALRVKTETRATRIEKNGLFHVHDQHGNLYLAPRLIVAAGVTQPYLPPVPGLELAEPYTTMPTDPADFINQRVLIIGKGNSAFETAENLIGTAAVLHLASPHPLKLAWQTHFVGNVRAVNNNLLDTYQLKSQNAVLDATIEAIERRADGRFAVTVQYAHAHGEREELLYDRVLACTGFRFDAELFDATCRPALTIDERFPQQTSEWESVNVKDLYFAGTLMQMRDYRQTTSGFIHGFRYNVRALQRIFDAKYEDQPWPARTIAATAESLREVVLARLNRSSALWQQFGFLCDAVILNPDGATADYYEEVPTDYLRDGAFGQPADCYTVTLEYGANHRSHDPFNVTRVARGDTARAEESNFLHPIIRRYAHGALVSEHHIIEDLAAEWVEPEHVEPLTAYFAQQLNARWFDVAATRPLVAQEAQV